MLQAIFESVLYVLQIAVPFIIIAILLFIYIKLMYKLEQMYRKKHGLNVKSFNQWLNDKTSLV